MICQRCGKQIAVNDFQSSVTANTVPVFCDECYVLLSDELLSRDLDDVMNQLRWIKLQLSIAPTNAVSTRAAYMDRSERVLRWLENEVLGGVT